ncbi:MAG: phosphoribosylpyrophosphate synthetase [Acidimicrobiia bacterium]|nr:phosphoribosylpyrophosphate synthetase [Acidimicrobiia bacterium]
MTDALTLLRSEGYVDDLDVCPDGLLCTLESEPQAFDDAVVDHLFRFEGASDPGDSSIVLGVSCPRWGRKGVVVSAYGPDVEPEKAELLLSLAGRHQPGS